MTIPRTAVAAVLLVVAAGLAVLGVYVHYGFTAMYGDITHSGPQEFLREVTGGIGVVPLLLVGLLSLTAGLLSSRRWMLLAAVAIPVVMVVSMLAVTGPALREKLADQYHATPQCVFEEEGMGEDNGAAMDSGPGVAAARASQEAFESIEHVGHFGGGGSSGVGGCDRSFVLTEDVDVMQHYRTALPDAGWRVVEDRADHLRAERDGMAFELFTCSRGGVVWAGPDGERSPGAAGCEHA